MPSSEVSTPPYPPASPEPTQIGPDGILYDFNLGARILVPKHEGWRWRVRLRDLDQDVILFDDLLESGCVQSSKRWFVRFGLEVFRVLTDGFEVLHWKHEYNASHKEILIQFPIGTLGDTLAWMPYAARFADERQARVICAMSPLLIPLFNNAYSEIEFVSHQEVIDKYISSKSYATYCLGLFFDDLERNWQPIDFRIVGLHKTAAYILGVPDREEPPLLSLGDNSRPIQDKYVCIAVQASTQAKMWNNPHGWRDVVKHLVALGFRVICIDQHPVHGQGTTWNHIPHGVEDQTGDKPLLERVRWLRHATMFIGASSGLAWLAWAAHCPVVMISGFTNPTNEFSTPYRIINWHTCNSCWNDVQLRFDHHDFLWCPRHKGSNRQFECTRLITSGGVKQVINRVVSQLPLRSLAVAE